MTQEALDSPERRDAGQFAARAGRLSIVAQPAFRLARKSIMFAFHDGADQHAKRER